MITGFVEREAVAVSGAGACRAGEVRPLLARRLDPLRTGPTPRSGVVPVRTELVAGVRYFGRYRSGWLRDGVLLSVG